VPWFALRDKFSNTEVLAGGETDSRRPISTAILNDNDGVVVNFSAIFKNAPATSVYAELKIKATVPDRSPRRSASSPIVAVLLNGFTPATAPPTGRARWYWPNRRALGRRVKKPRGLSWQIIEAGYFLHSYLAPGVGWRHDARRIRLFLSEKRRICSENGWPERSLSMRQ
jgi:hypothetical protein